MILVDFSSISIASVLGGLKSLPELNAGIIKHLVLQNIVSIRKRHSNKYGELVICCDSKESWRKESFPFYKANRKSARDKIDVDWNLLFATMDELITDLQENFPYLTIKVDGAEADDIIATMIREASPEEKILVVSNDKDFFQFQLHYKNVDQWLPAKERMYKCTYGEAIEQYYQHVIRGDATDGIPNILSDDDAIMNPDKRQARLTSKYLTEVVTQLEAGKPLAEKLQRNLSRNKMLIDLTKIPSEVSEAIIAEKSRLEAIRVPNRSKVYNYLIVNRLRNLMDSLTYF